MANICNIIKSPKYQHIKECASTSDYKNLTTLSSYYIDTIDQLPYMDELAFIDSSKYLQKKLAINNDGCTTIQNILEYTNTDSLGAALIKLNSELHPDLNINLLSYGDSIKVYYKRRPHKINGISSSSIDIQNIPYEHKQIIFQNMLFELAKQFGIQFNYITSQELNSDQWVNLIGDAKLSNAFVYQGQIYINTDNASIDAPLHELTHILLGNIRYINPTLYNDLLQQVQKLPNIEKLFPRYLNRTREDILEEILVTEFSKYMSGYTSLFNDVSKQHIHNIQYYMFRCLDTMIEGNFSASSIPLNELSSQSLNSLLYKLESNHLFNNRSGKGDLSYIHRIVNNEKAKLIESKDLIEEC